MSLKQDFKQILKPYYLFNLLLSVSFVVLKRVPHVCNYVFHVDDCEFDGRESEILFFLLIVIMIRSRKSGNVSMLNYLSSSFIYTKLANLILWFNADAIMGTVYAIIFITGALLMPEPTYRSSDNVIYFHGFDSLQEELRNSCGNGRKYWLIAFYAAWSPPCVALAPHFAELSNQYHVDGRFQWGKIDVGRFPQAAHTYRINVGALSKQLPTLVLFVDGEEVGRAPQIDSKGNVTAKVTFNANSIRAMFDLNNVHAQCKQQVAPSVQTKPKKQN